MQVRKRGLLAGLLAVMLLLVVAPAAAQDETVLQVALPEFFRGTMNDTVFQQFEADHPGTRVEIVYTGFDTLSLPRPADDLTGFLDDLASYAATADVLTVQNGNIDVEGTRAGYFLDLAPLTNADTTLNVDDFVPSIWQSFQWDNGIWALPVSTDVVVVVYNPQVFDEKGLAYPNENWSLEDYANAADALSERDASGKVTTPGLVTFQNDPFLFYSLTSTGFYDASAFPDAPAFDTPALEDVLTRWNELVADGTVSSSFSGDINDAPFKIINSIGLTSFGRGGGNNQNPAMGALLPGGTAGIEAQGFAVSSGTKYPELAYELAAYMTNSPNFASNPFGVAPARYSLIGVQADTGNGNGPGGGGFGRRRNFSAENQAVIDAAIQNGIPMSEMRYYSYVVNASSGMSNDGLDAKAALQEAEATAVANLQTAEDRKTTTVVLVATPVPQIVLQSGEIALNFGIQSFIQPMPNLNEWKQLVNDFVAADPQVGEINLDTDGGFGRGGGGAGGFAQRDDCFYLPYNAVPNADLSTIVPLDPYLDADPDFDRSDVVGNALELVQKDGQTWGLPVVIQPDVLWYNSVLFDRNRIDAPVNGWMIDQFSDALKQLKINPEDPTPFVPRGASANYILMLAAAYGGIPLDQRTSPPTVNYTDANAVNALRQVLDLAKAGYIDYQEQARGNFIINIDGNVEPAPVYTESLNGFSVRFIAGGRSEDPQSGYGLTTYPNGNQYNAVSYDVGSAYISATSQNPDACYRFIAEVAKHPELFSAMPARRSLINGSTYAASTSADTITLYNRFDQLMTDPNTINFQSPFGGGTNPTNFIVEFWLYRAFDNYVLNGADLDTELSTAQSNAVAYQECAASIPARSPDQNNREYSQQFLDCAAKIDPNLGGLFGGPGG
ncbi:MAG: extracellular solute-binding protein [Anaerolineae bacterium]